MTGAPPAPPSHSFTLKANGGLFRVLLTDCQVSVGYDPASGDPQPTWTPFKAIWDTGATNTVITPAVAQACGLKAISKTIVHGVNGQQISDVYLINIRLPHGVAYANLRVTEGQLKGGNDGDILIGMDIITSGDFAITNQAGVTTFSFRHPSAVTTDYVVQHHSKQQLGSKSKKSGKKHGKHR